VEHHYLIAEDDENTCFLIQRAYKNIGMVLPVHFVSDGEAAIEYLNGVGRFQDRSQFPLPALLLLDLKMPRKNGLEVLEWLRQSSCRELIVVMFSGSDDERDVRAAYQLCVNSFIHKPVNFSELQQTLAAIHEYWFGYNYPPNAGGVGRKRATS
jgi:CheY-like chemotaxis protein